MSQYRSFIVALYADLRGRGRGGDESGPLADAEFEVCNWQSKSQLKAQNATSKSAGIARISCHTNRILVALRIGDKSMQSSNAVGEAYASPYGIA